MATDVRKHQAPAAAETPRRQAINDLSMSIRDVVPVANVTERTQLVEDLVAAGQGPAVTRPLYVYRADAPPTEKTEVTDDGETWRVLNARNRRVDAGTTDVSINSAGSGTATATFILGLFTESPHVVASCSSGAGAQSNITVRTSSSSTANVTIVVNNADPSSTVPVSWMAVQR